MDDDLTGLVIDDTREKMHKAIDHVKSEMSNVRTGRASSALLEPLIVDYYGTSTPLRQLAGFSVPDAMLLVITPYDKGSLGDIERAIKGSDLGINPTNDGNVIRLAFPSLTEERRKELVKVAHKYVEAAKVAVRHVRRDGLDVLKKLLKDHQMSEDDEKRAAEQVQKLTDETIGDIDRMLAGKEKEILTV